MQAMKDFTMWFLDQIPAFLMAEPMCYFVGFAFLLVVISVFRDIISIK